MIIMKVVINHVASFNHVEFNFSYPRRIKDSTIPYEFLEGRENFRFKRVNILMGANASGKTMFGRVLLAIHHYMNNGNLGLTDWINDKSDDENESSYFELDYVHELKLYRLKTTFNKAGILSEKLQSIEIMKNDSYEKAIEKLLIKKEDIEYIYNSDLKNEEVPSKTSKIFLTAKYLIPPSWLYFLSEHQENATPIFKQLDIDVTILKNILIAFDSTIQDVVNVGKTNKSFLITFNNGNDVTLTDGELSNKNRLSKGTQESIQAALIAMRMKTFGSEISSTYFSDELISHAHSEMEQAILNLYISLLGRHDQLFYTTHNHDILEMNIPLHAFLFFKKDKYTEIIDPSETYKKNDRNLLNAVKNDVFQMLPDTHQITNLIGHL